MLGCGVCLVCNKIINDDDDSAPCACSYLHTMVHIQCSLWLRLDSLAVVILSSFWNREKKLCIISIWSFASVGGSMFVTLNMGTVHSPRHANRSRISHKPNCMWSRYMGPVHRRVIISSLTIRCEYFDSWKMIYFRWRAVNRKTDKFCNQFDYYHLHTVTCEQLPPNGHAAPTEI